MKKLTNIILATAFTFGIGNISAQTPSTEYIYRNGHKIKKEIYYEDGRKYTRYTNEELNSEWTESEPIRNNSSTNKSYKEPNRTYSKPSSKKSYNYNSSRQTSSSSSNRSSNNSSWQKDVGTAALIFGGIYVLGKFLKNKKSKNVNKTVEKTPSNSYENNVQEETKKSEKLYIKILEDEIGYKKEELSFKDGAIFNTAKDKFLERSSYGNLFLSVEDVSKKGVDVWWNEQTEKAHVVFGDKGDIKSGESMWDPNAEYEPESNFQKNMKTGLYTVAENTRGANTILKTIEDGIETEKKIREKNWWND